MTTTPARSATLAVPGARLHHELRGAGPLVALVGSPMGAGFFAPLADLLADDHTVLTLDPRGIGRSPVDDSDAESPVATRADDLARLLAHVDAGPAVVLGSSGGATVALELAAARPELVAAVIAHEPPAAVLMPDSARRLAETEEVVRLYRTAGSGAAWARFLADANLPDADVDADAEPGAPSERDPQEIADERHFFLAELRATVGHRPDVAALRSGPVRVVVAIGEDSAGQVCEETSTALAAALGRKPVRFPGDHVGFGGVPEAFAARLRDVLDADR